MGNRPAWKRRVDLTKALLRILLCIGAGSSAAAGTDGAGTPIEARARRTPAVSKSRHFILHTDLAPGDAVAVLHRMESTLRFAAEYWGRPPRGQIECYVVSDLRNWPDWALPHPLARVVVGGIGGATLRHHASGDTIAPHAAVIYASAVPGVAEHEVIHAYCMQNYNETGPQWYKEGMAEMAVLGFGGVHGVRSPPEPLARLRRDPLRPIREILATGQVAGKISGALDAILEDHGGAKHQVRHDAWTPENAAMVLQAREQYLSSWALCYLLHNNPNYSDRFRALGDDYLMKRNTSFEQVFGPMAREIMFEYAFFLKRVDVGYRVDVCRWDWNRRGRRLDDGTVISDRCLAARGWQASELFVAKGDHYAYQTTGSWSTAGDLAETDADGAADGSGRLTAAVMNGFHLGEPFQLGCRGNFVSTMTGRLHLRCADAWNRLSDNRGEVQVRFSRAVGGDPCRKTRVSHGSAGHP